MQVSHRLASMEWNTLIAFGGTIFGAVVGAGASIWLGKAQHVNDSKKWEMDNKLSEYVRVVIGFGDLHSRLFDYLYLSEATRTDVHDTFNKAHRTTTLLLAPTEVLVKYNAMYALFSQYIGKCRKLPLRRTRMNGHSSKNLTELVVESWHRKCARI